MTLPQKSIDGTLPRRRSLGRAATAALLLGGLLSAPCRAQQPAPPPALQTALVLQQAIVQAIARAENSVVAIARVRKGSDLIRLPKPSDPAFVPNEYGTGVVVGSDGLILTNYHVIGDPAENDYYVWASRKPYEVVAVQAADPWMDLAVLKVDADDLEPITFGDTTNLRKGQIVIALGNPYAIARDGQVSASWGIISNLSRKATKNPTDYEPLQRGQTLHHYGTLIQTDAKLNLGTSGGALINLRGEMIGLTTSLAAMDRYEKSAGFAIPVDDAFQRTLEKLKRGQRAEFGFLGVRPSERTSDERRRGALGVRIDHVFHGTPASVAGVRPGDVITHVDGHPIRDAAELMRDLGRNPVGARVQLTIQRGGRSLQTVATLSKKHIDTSRPAYALTPPRSWRGLRVDYATAIAYPSFLENSRNIDPQGCVAIVEVDRDSPAWKAGLRPNTFVSFVEDQRVSTPDQFYQAVAHRQGPVRIRLTAAPGSTSPLRTVAP